MAYGNSKAFAAVGITANTPDPPQGRYVRENGKLTGRIEESPAYAPFQARMPKLTPQEFLRGIRRFFDNAAAAGCTSLHDAGLRFGQTVISGPVTASAFSMLGQAFDMFRGGGGGPITYEMKGKLNGSGFNSTSFRSKGELDVPTTRADDHTD